MKYILCEEPGRLALKEKDEPKRGNNEVLLKIKTIGICGTDLHAFKGNQAYFSYPRILGHELAAEVVESENNSGFKPGDKVAIMPYLSCGNCIACVKGKVNCCVNIKVFGVHIDGGMQEKVVLPAHVLIPTPRLSNEEIAVIEPLAIAAHAIRRAHISAGDTVLVMGCGPIGIGIMKLAQIKGASVIAMDINRERLQYARDKIGVNAVVMADEKALEVVKDMTGGDLAGTVFDATGNKMALESGVQYMSHGGKYVLVGLSKGDLTFNHPVIHSKETTILCSRNATREDFEIVIDVLEKGVFPTASFVTHRVPFNEMIAGFESWTKPETGVVKAMVNMD